METSGIHCESLFSRRVGTHVAGMIAAVDRLLTLFSLGFPALAECASGKRSRLLLDGSMNHNNISELNLRRQVLGRRNWLFVGSDDGAAVNTVFVSRLASGRLHGIEPHGYLRDLFCLLRTWSADCLLELAAAYWQETLQQPETQHKLAANVFRRVVLSPVDPRVAPISTARRWSRRRPGWPSGYLALNSRAADRTRHRLVEGRSHRPTADRIRPGKAAAGSSTEVPEPRTSSAAFAVHRCCAGRSHP